MALQLLSSISRLLGKGRPLYVLIFSCMVFAAKADKVWLENGDVISGEIKSLEAGQLKLATEYAGEITVSWRHVRTVESDDPVWVTFIGEDEAAIRELKSDGQELVVVDQDGVERNFSAAWAVASITQEKPALPESWEFSGNFGVNMDSTKGNEEEWVFNLDGALNINDQWNKNRLAWDVEVENDDGTKTTDWELGYTYSRYFTEHWFVQGAADMNYDSDDDLYSRSSIGASLGYRFRETSQDALLSSVGFSQLWEKYDSEGKVANTALTWSAFYRSKLTESLEYFVDSKIYYRIDSRQWLLDGEQGLRFGVTDNLSLNLTHLLDYDSEPGEDSQKADSQMKMGVGYRW